MNEVVLTRRAQKDLENLEREIRGRITGKLKEYCEEPLGYARKLSNPLIGTYRYRIGDYRVVFDIDGDTIVILRIGHRKNIYN